MMKLKKPAMLKKPAVEEAPAKKEEKSKSKKNIPSDTYKNEFEPIEFVVDDNRKIVISVKRGGEFGLPCLDVRTYQTTEVYTGFTKKGINIPLEFMSELLFALNTAQEKSEELGLFDECECDEESGEEE